MEIKTIKTESGISVGGVTLVPIVESGCAAWRMSGRLSVTGYKHPLAIIVIMEGQKKAYRVSGEEIAIEELVSEYPSVKESIENL
jgi:hypothetical protein